MAELARSGERPVPIKELAERRRPQSRSKACHDEGQDQTMLGGCVKTYIPWPDGRFGAVFVAVKHPQRPLALRAFAFGVRHHPPESNAETVYEVADRRLRKKDS